MPSQTVVQDFIHLYIDSKTIKTWAFSCYLVEEQVYFPLLTMGRIDAGIILYDPEHRRSELISYLPLMIVSGTPMQTTARVVAELIRSPCSRDSPITVQPPFTKSPKPTTHHTTQEIPQGPWLDSLTLSVQVTGKHGMSSMSQTYLE